MTGLFPYYPQEAHTWPVLRLVWNNLFVCFLMKVKKNYRGNLSTG